MPLPRILERDHYVNNGRRNHEFELYKTIVTIGFAAPSAVKEKLKNLEKL